MALTNPKLASHRFLLGMHADDYYPVELVVQGAEILMRLCERIEAESPQTDADVYRLTHAATEEFNDLAQAFAANGSEIETVARDCIGEEFDLIAAAYGYNLDSEELIAPREW